MRSSEPSDPAHDPPFAAGPSDLAEGLGAISRRRFALSLGAAALCATSATAEAAADEPQPIEGLSAAEVAEVQARYANLVRVYGPRLSAPEQKLLHRVLVTNEHMLASIRSFLVKNGDTSACTLRLVPSSAPAV